MLKTKTGVVTLTDISEIIDVQLQRWIVFVIHVTESDAIKRTVFLPDTLGLLVGWLGRHEREWEAELEFEIVIGNQFVELGCQCTRIKWLG